MIDAVGQPVKNRCRILARHNAHHCNGLWKKPHLIQIDRQHSGRVRIVRNIQYTRRLARQHLKTGGQLDQRKSLPNCALCDWQLLS